MHKNYFKYSVFDFLSDQDFILWAGGKDSKKSIWEELKNDNSPNQDEFNSAVRIFNACQEKKHELPEKDVKTIWELLLSNSSNYQKRKDRFRFLRSKKLNH